MTEAKYDETITKIKGLVTNALGTDGSDHKQWYLVKIAEILFKDYSMFKNFIDEGIAP